MNSLTDQQLLREYTVCRSEAAFAELVRRHVDFVYSAALRMVRDAHLAEDVTQSVFVALAQNARQLTNRAVLSGWLHRTTQNLAANAVRSDVRRRAREQEAAAMNELQEPDAVWEQVAPHLDDALGELSEADRDALLLRYFEDKSAHEIALTLGVSDDAAQKRVSRAVERLREFFAKRGVTAGASGLVVLISANAVQAAPFGLSASISTSAALSGAAVHQTATIGLTKTLAMTTIQKTLIAATLAAAVGTGIYEARRASHWESEMQTLQQQQTPLADQVGRLQKQRDEANGNLEARQLENEQLRHDTAELAKLRGEVARLRADAQELTQLKAAGVQKGIDPTDLALISWLDRAKQLKRLPEKMPDKMIPELQLLTEDDWLQMCKDPLRHLGKEVNLNDDSTARLVFSHVRMKAKEKFANMLSKALHGYTDANSGQLPADMLQFKPYFESGVDETTLLRYEILQTGKMEDVPNEGVILAEKTPVDSQYDTRLLLGKNWRRIDNNVEAYSGENPTPRESKPLEK